MAEMRDAQARMLAATTFDRNVVVTAGAGTGKTTLLVERLVHLIVKSPHPVPLTHIVALTFMIKAAHEIKSRLQERLLELAERPEAATEFLERYRLSTSELAERAAAAALDVERSQIGTIHSFAAHVLRLYPVEAGVDPGFEPDEGDGFSAFFQREWTRWLKDELGVDGAGHEAWRRALRLVGIEDLYELSSKLVNDVVPLDALMQQTQDSSLPMPLRTWLQDKRDQARHGRSAFLDAGKKPRQVEHLLAAAQSVFDLVLARGEPGSRACDEDTTMLLNTKDPGSKPPAGWDKEAFDEARRIIQTARSLLRTDHAYFRDLLALLTPFLLRCRQRFLESGAITFDGLLVRARDLLRDHPSIRQRLAAQFQAILVDEFQDTDPVQYEIILLVCERAGRPVAEWQDVQLEPGKLFIVGDPKQSIFAFRRADIDAFQHVTARVLAQGGLPLTLTTNFRSHATIIATVNGIFERLLAEGRGPQPRYSALDPQPDRSTGASTQGVTLRLVAAPGGGASDDHEEREDLNASQAVRAEAESLARWLKTDVIGREILTSRNGPPRAVAPGDVALLFRTLTESHHYLEALRRQGLRYVAEGERHFYRRQEVIDLVNLLRCLQRPDDHVALAGLLRSALGTLTDRELVELVALEGLDSRGGGPSSVSRHSRATHLQRLYLVIESLRRDCPMKPLPDALDLVFARLPVLELAAASLHGEQAVANLVKIREMAEDLVDDPDMTWEGFVALLAARINDPPKESESGLAEEARDALRVMSLHKAKGLEFPLVVLVGIHTGTKGRQDSIQVLHDWSTDMAGIRVGSTGTMGGLFASDKLDARMVAEQRRLLYVGMTRAKERLILSGALTGRSSPGSLLSLLRTVLGEAVGKRDVTDVAVGEGGLTQSILPADEGRPRERVMTDKPSVSADDVSGYEARWQARESRWAQCRERSVWLTPTLLRPQGRAHLVASDRNAGSKRSGMTVGALVHKELETWTYRETTHARLEHLAQGLGCVFPGDVREHRAEIIAEACDVLTTFARSEVYAALRGVTIVGREVPFLMPWQSSHCSIMEGRIDLIYEQDGALWVADYKTDRLTEADIPERMERYRAQATIYAEAVRRAVGRPLAGVTLIFLRLGISVPVVV